MSKDNIQSLATGTLLQKGRYRIVKVLGCGTFGITYLATAKATVQGAFGITETDIKVAIKEFFMSDVNNRCSGDSKVEGSTGSAFSYYRNRFRKEAENLSHMNHPNIIKVMDVFDENDTSYYVMQYIEGENLDEYIEHKGHLEEIESISIVTEVVEALEYMHRNNMLHLDLKPKNIMCGCDGRISLIDFGLSKQFTDNGEPESSTSIGLGTPGYAPLEQSQYKHDGILPVTLDVYALGGSMFKMLSGERPPEASVIFNEGFPEDTLKSKGVNTSTISAIKKAMAPAKRDRFSDVRSFLNDLPVVSTKKMPKVNKPKEDTIFDKIINDDDTVFDDKKIDNNKQIDNNSKDKSYTAEEKIAFVKANGFKMWRDRHWFTNIMLISGFFVFGWFLTCFLNWSIDYNSYENFRSLALSFLSFDICIRLLGNHKSKTLICLIILSAILAVLPVGYLAYSISVALGYLALLFTLMIKKDGVKALHLLGKGVDNPGFAIWKQRNWFTNLSICGYLLIIIWITVCLLEGLNPDSSYYYKDVIISSIGLCSCYGMYLLFRNNKFGLIILTISPIWGLIDIESDGLIALLFCLAIMFLTLLIRKNGRSALSLMKWTY